MVDQLTSIDVSHVIQLSVAPVFLLAGIGSILGVMANRLARVVDTARALETRLPNVEGEVSAGLHTRLLTLGKRAHLLSRAIALCTLTALLVCAVIITLFIGAFFAVNASLPAALLFISALLSFATALVWFLRDIFLAISSLHIGPVERRPS